jgi:hypothetical protein
MLKINLPMVILPGMENGKLKLSDIATIFPAQAQRKAEKFPLREVEETTKGHWVAFADDGPESYDVQVDIEKGAIIHHSCDCGKLDTNGFCLHQLAMLMHLHASRITPVKKVTKRKGKEDPLTVMLNQLEPEELKSWLREVLHQQKDLAIAFTNRFGAKPGDYTEEEIQFITDKAVKSIVKNKRRIDQSELKKIVLLLKEVQQPVMEYYLRNITDSTKVSLLAKLLQSIENWHYAFKIKSTKIPAYKTELLAQTIQPLYNIENVKVWQKVIATYFEVAFKESNPLGADWQTLLLEIAKLDRRQERTDYLLASFKDVYLSNKALNNGLASGQLTKSIWDLYHGLNRLPDCIKWIAPIYHENTFNLTLIDTLLDNGQPDIAEQHCINIIKHNYYEEFNEPYQERLMHLYATNPAKRKELHALLLHMLPASGDFEDYKMLRDEYFSNKPEELKKWKMKILAHLAVLMKDSISRAKFLFSIYDDENKSDKMLDKIPESVTIEPAIIYFEKLYKFSKEKFLESLLNFSATYTSQEYNERLYPALNKLVKEQYSAEEILTGFQKTRSFYRGTFAKYLEKNMQV